MLYPPYTGCIKIIGAVWKLIIFTSMVKRLINTSRNERVTLQVYDTCLQMFLFFGLRRKDCLTRSTLSSDTRGRPALFPLQRHPVVWNCWYQRLMLLGDGGSLLNCRRNARWTETTDSCFTNCSTQNAFCSGVAIIALLRHRPREKRGVGLRMRTKLEHLLFRSMWETYFCVRFDCRNGRLKPLQSFSYTLYNYGSYNESQRDALFPKFILAKDSTSFRQIYCPSSKVSTLYTQQYERVFVNP